MIDILILAHRHNSLLVNNYRDIAQKEDNVGYGDSPLNAALTN